MATDLFVDRDHRREAAGSDASDALDREAPGGIGVGAVGHAQAASKLVSHLDRTGDVACRAFANPDDVLAHGMLSELTVERGDAGDLRRSDPGCLADPPQSSIRKVSVAGLNGLKDWDDGLGPPALSPDDFF